ncbi:MAG: serine hydrolase [Gemmatimonadaceae bacterium]
MRLRFPHLGCVVLVALSSASLLAQGQRRGAPRAAGPDWAAFDAYVAQGVKDWQIPGLAIAVVKDDSVVFAKGYGVRRLGGTEPVTEHTLFAIGSTTKAMTAASLGMLVDEGKVRWDEPVVSYLPTLQLYDPVMTRELTVRDLLTHHSGLPESDLLWAGGDYSTQEIIRRMRFVKPFASFRNGYSYMNVQYAMAGEVLRAASGTPWADFVSQRIFTPLGMRETVPTLAATATMPNVASPHMRIRDTIRVIQNRPVDPVAPAGAIWSSVWDMAKWMRFVLDSGRVGGKRLLTEGTYREWLSPQVIVPRNDFYPTTRFTRPHYTAYGLGWFLQDYRGQAVAMHTGSIDGMIAILGLIPDQRLGVYVLANFDHAELRHALMWHVFDMYMGGGTRDWSRDLKAMYDSLGALGRAAEEDLVKSRATGTRPSLPLERYVGTYADSLVGTATVTLEQGGLQLRVGKGFEGRLRAMAVRHVQGHVVRRAAMVPRHVWPERRRRSQRAPRRPRSSDRVRARALWSAAVSAWTRALLALTAYPLVLGAQAQLIAGPEREITARFDAFNAAWERRDSAFIGGSMRTTRTNCSSSRGGS